MEGGLRDARTLIAKARRRRRALALFITVVLLMSVVPAHMPTGSAQGTRGYMVFRDSVLVGPDADATFHVVVPAGVSVLAADLDLLGTVGVLPVATATDADGDHGHTLSDAGLHLHPLGVGGIHDHSLEPGANHTHGVFVYGTSFQLDDARMSATLPSHTHTYDGVARTMDPYDFVAVTSDGHNHTAPAHKHDTLISLSGDHGHDTSGGGLHHHAVTEAGAHVHVTGMSSAHDHSLAPGWSMDWGGTRPSGVTVELTAGQSTYTVPGSFGDQALDWHRSIDLGGRLSEGVTEVRLTSDTVGQLEYVLVLEVDAFLGVIAGHGPLGPGGSLPVPVWGPNTTTNATAYLFGDDLAVPVSAIDRGGNHSHDALDDASHTHSTDGSGEHGHIVTGGGHVHNVSVAEAAPPTTTTVPVWNLTGHNHQITWQDTTVVGLGSHAYGTVRSRDHSHTVVSHDHTVTMVDSGDHQHNLSQEGGHIHDSNLTGVHDHLATDAPSHAHGVSVSPTSSSTGGPTGVRAYLDGVDLTDGSGGPWDLDGSPVPIPLTVGSWDDHHVLNLTAATAGSAEWVIVLEMAAPVLIVSASGMPGEMRATVPLPAATPGARVGLLASPYVMPVSSTSARAGGHAHTTTMDGDHHHDCTQEGVHTHDLGMAQHVHVMELNDSVAAVADANGSVDLPPHTHIIPLGSPLTTQATVNGVTGGHMHDTLPHAHGVEWLTSGGHTHVSGLAGNHTHILEQGGGHNHTMWGGEHVHAVEAGVTYDASYPSPANVSVWLGTSDPGATMPGGGSVWWAETDVQGDHLQGGSALLNITSGKTGTVSVVIMVQVDTEPPDLQLVSAPGWVSGGTFDVTVRMTEDTDAVSVALDLGPITVGTKELDPEALTVTFHCTVTAEVPEGRYDINASATDRLGNSGNATLGTLGVDRTAPVSLLAIGSPSREEAGVTWVFGGTPFDITATDVLSGVAAIEYRLAGGGPWTTYDPGSPAILEGADDGSVLLEYRAVDRAGATEEGRSVQLALDSTAPTVSVVATPSRPGDDPYDMVVGNATVIELSATDGSGIGPGAMEFRVRTAEAPDPPWSTYSQAIAVSAIETDSMPPGFWIEAWARDLVGNGGPALLTSVRCMIDVVAPVPSPTKDLSLPPYTREAGVEVVGNIPGDVARFHYRLEVGAITTIDVTPGTDFAFHLDLTEGENLLLYFLEDAVGNTSPWEVGGVIILDTVDPSLVRADPVDGSEDLTTRNLSIDLHFSEVVNVTRSVVTVDGEGTSSYTLGPGWASSAGLVFTEELPDGADIRVRLEFEDPAGNAASAELAFQTRVAEEEVSTGFMFGLLAGIIIAVILVYMVTWRRKQAPRALISADLEEGDDILAPEETMDWPSDEEEALEGGEEDLEEEAEEPEEEEDLEEEAEEPEEEEEDLDREVEPDEDEGGEDLEDDIDALLADLDDMAGDVGEADDDGDGPSRWRDEPPAADADALPDPDDPTVDPGARF